MAGFLLPSYVDPTRVDALSSAYAKVNAVTINVAENRAQIDVMIYASKADYAAGAMPISTLSVRFGSDGVPAFNDFLTSNAAAWAAMQAAFAGAIMNHPSLAGATPA